MYDRSFFKQFVDCQKLFFDNSYTAGMRVQMQAEFATSLFWGNEQWLPSEGRQWLGQWKKAVRRGQKDFKEIVDHNYDLLYAALP